MFSSTTQTVNAVLSAPPGGPQVNAALSMPPGGPQLNDENASLPDPVASSPDVDTETIWLTQEDDYSKFTFTIPGRFYDTHITKQLIILPVMLLQDKQIYDARGIAAWLGRQGTSPVTRANITTPVLEFQPELYAEICAHLEKVVQEHQGELQSKYPNSLSRLEWRKAAKKKSDEYFTDLAKFCKNYNIVLKGFSPVLPELKAAPIELPWCEAEAAVRDQPMPLPVQPLEFKPVASGTVADKETAIGNNQGTVAFPPGLVDVCRRYEVPLALAQRLAVLKDDYLYFLVDTSGSMSEHSSTLCSNATNHFQKDVRYREGFLTRYEAVENRLHQYIDLLAYFQKQPIIISLFDTENLADHWGGNYAWRNRYNPQINLTITDNESYEIFRARAHYEIRRLFSSRLPKGPTPAFQNIRSMLDFVDGIPSRKSLYFMTDGEPTGGCDEIDNITQLLSGRAPLSKVTLLGASDKQQDDEWIFSAAEECPEVAAIADYHQEEKRVHQHQGPGFHYSQGLWLISSLLTAYYPEDLGHFCREIPFSKEVLNKALCMALTDEGYRHYFRSHPAGHRLAALLPSFLTCSRAVWSDYVKVFDEAYEHALEFEEDHYSDGKDAEKEGNKAATHVVRFQSGLFQTPSLPQSQVLEQKEIQSCGCTIQ